jgi:hypothetical protein
MMTFCSDFPNKNTPRKWGVLPIDTHLVGNDKISCRHLDHNG